MDIPIKVYLDFDLGIKSVVLYGNTDEKNYTLERGTEDLEVTWQRASQLRDWGWSADTIKCFVRFMLPFGGLRLDFFKDNSVKRTDYVLFNESYYVQDLVKFDRLRVKFFTPEELIVVGVPDNIQLLGNDQDDRFNR